MAVVVKWKADGEYLAALEKNTGRFLWAKDRKRALRFESQAEAKRRIVEHMGVFPYTSAEVAFVRLAQKRRAEAAEPAKVTHGGVTVTAPETMTLGEVWAALSSAPALRVCLDAEVRKAREEARALTPEAVQKARCDVQTAVLEDAFRAGIEEGERRARIKAADTGTRIEKRAEREWLVNSGRVINACMAKQGNSVCHYHYNGEHVSTSLSKTDVDGAELVVARWPIAPATDTRAASDAGGGP